MPKNTKHQSEPYAPPPEMISSQAAGGMFEGELVSRREVEELAPSETTRFEHLEGVIKTGLNTFYEVGNALVEIRENRLYRAAFDTFEAYCQGSWGMTRQHANRMISAAQIVEVLEPTGSTPQREAVARPLARLNEADAVEAWNLALQKAGDEPVTAALVEEAAQEVSPRPIRPRSEREEIADANNVDAEEVLIHGEPPNSIFEIETGDGTDDDTVDESEDEFAEAESGMPAPKPRPNLTSATTPRPAPDAKAPDVPKVAAPPAPVTAPASAPAAPKTPEGFVQTFVPRDDCFFLQDAGYAMQDIFSFARQLHELGAPLGLSPDDLMTTLKGALGLDEEETQ